MEIINLIENTSIRNRIKCEHGLSLFIRIGDKSILFDVGQSDKFLQNAIKLGVDLEDVDYVILSHGHYDHTGGLPAFLEINKKAKVYLHPESLKQRFSRSSKTIKENGVPWIQALEAYKDRFQFIEESTELIKGLWIVSDIKRDLELCELDERLVTRSDKGYLPDEFNDELVLLVQSHEGAVVLTGCAHNGIINILNSIHDQMGPKPFRLVVGGLHLMGKEATEIKQIIAQLQQFEINQWALNHCTGHPAVEEFREAFPTKAKYFRGGEKILVG